MYKSGTQKTLRIKVYFASVTLKEIKPERKILPVEKETKYKTVRISFVTSIFLMNRNLRFVSVEPKTCGNRDCQNTRSFQLKVKQSSFADWQRVRLQENSEDIPPGSMPRSIDVTF